MIKNLIFIFLISSYLNIFVSSAYAYDPLSVPNNKVGVHILEPSEIDAAAKLVNSGGGDWGYVTIPIRSNDRDPAKWQEFFSKARLLHIIPIIRLATYPAFNGWIEPNAFDLVDFANFLSDMPWPTSNRYIILFNEPNHSNEWGGFIDPRAYATLILDAQNIFKSRSADYFLLSAGLDMSAPNSVTSQDALEYYRRMTAYQPDWPSKIDGFSVHVYPDSRAGIVSYRREPTGSKPIFITETGWIGQPDLYPQTLSQIWTEPTIVAITPFLLFAGAGDFVKFSLIGSPAYTGLVNLSKTAGSPLLTPVTLPTVTATVTTIFKQVLTYLGLVPHRLKIGNVTLDVELADTQNKRQKGLSNRPGLLENSGMLFIFPYPDKHTFWMKDMRFPLDFVWIRNGRIVEITPDISPPETLVPSQLVDEVLEISAGSANKYGITVGSYVERGW